MTNKQVLLAITEARADERKQIKEACKEVFNETGKFDIDDLEYIIGMRQQT